MSITVQDNIYHGALARNLFIPLKNHDCSTGFFVNGGGKRTLIKYFLSHQHDIQVVFGSQFETTLFVYVDPDEIVEISSQKYIQLMFESLVRELLRKKMKVNPKDSTPTDPLNSIKNILRELTDQNMSIIFILNDFELTLTFSESVYRNLESIMAIDKSRITYLFLSSINLLSQEVLHKLHNLKYAVTQHITFFPLFSEGQTKVLIQNQTYQLKMRISPEINSIIFEWCGGHPQLTKYALYNIQASSVFKKVEKISEFLIQDKQLTLILQDIWKYLQPIEQEIILNVVRTGIIPDSLKANADFLLKLNIIQPVSDNSFKLFGKLFSHFVLQQIPQTKLEFDTHTNQLYLGSVLCAKTLTLQEYKILVHLVTNSNKIISRDEVAYILWGEHSHEKYSDWTIDKIISTLRKKLDEIGYSSAQLVTLKKRGIVLNQ